SSFSGQPVLLINPEGSEDNSNRQQVTAIDEGNITSAMMKITDPTPKVLYFLGGHGEMSPLDPAGKLNEVITALEQQNYTLQMLSLVGKDAKIPDDAAALVVVAPEQDLSPQEADLLEDYINGKGHLVVMLDPPGGSTSKW